MACVKPRRDAREQAELGEQLARTIAKCSARAGLAQALEASEQAGKRELSHADGFALALALRIATAALGLQGREQLAAAAIDAHG